MTDVHWQHYFARKFSLQRFEVVMRVFISDFWQKEFGVYLQNALVIPGEGKNHAIWMDRDEWPRAEQKVFQTVYRDLVTWHRYKAIIKTTQTQWVTAAEKIGETATAQSSMDELAALFDTFIFHHQAHFNGPIWIPFATEPLVAEAAEKTLQTVLARAKKESEFQACFDIIFSPEEKNAISSSQEALLALALDCKKGVVDETQKAKWIASIVKQFGFIPCYDVIDAPWDAEYFRGQLQEFLAKETADLEKEYYEGSMLASRNRSRFQEFLRNYDMTPSERELFIMAHDLVFIKDERDDYRRRGCYFGRPLFLEMSRRLGLSGADASYFTIAELKRALRGDTHVPDAAIIAERVQGYFLMYKNGGSFEVASGEEMCRRIALEVGQETTTVVSELKGISASRGQATGPAVIVKTRHDLSRVTHGAIMIAVTTNPDFVPAMRVCAAIVTNEGGITSHAAIVSRELGIPCVVGTHVGTRSFHDGDLITVDAERGVVKKLKAR